VNSESKGSHTSIPGGPFWLLFIIFAVAAGAVYYFNYCYLQLPLGQVLAADGRNSGISVRAHYGRYYDSSVLVFDLQGVDGEKAPIDVFRLLLQYAAKLRDRHFATVALSCKGMEKFHVPGMYFRQLGREYGEQNPIYTARTFPEHLLTPMGDNAYQTWTGGMLGVLNQQLDDFNDFHRRWYFDDI
jgi:hypothetical protein